MTFGSVLKFSLVGFALQALLFVIAMFAGLSIRKAWANLYWVWIELGGLFDRSSGSGGHAFAGGAILGFFLGVSVYSLLISVVICYFRARRSVN